MEWQDLEVGGATAWEDDFPVGSVTLVLADVEGSSRLWQQGAQMPAALADLDAVVDGAVLAHGGVRPADHGEADGDGDGNSFVIAFANPLDAVGCALAIQQAQAGSPLQLRMALNTGDVELRHGGRYPGPAINRCARIRNAGHGGQVLLGESTRDLILDCLPDGAWLEDLGYHSFPDLPRPEHIYQLRHAALPGDLPPLRSLDVVRHNLPEQLSSFIGREPELADLQTALADNRLVTLTGAGGCGKTRLALEVAGRVAGDYRDGVWWVDLASISDPDLLVSTVMSVLRVREVGDHDRLDTLRAFLADKQLLLLLDNCEHLIESCTSLAHALLVGCPHVGVLAGSREPLGIAGELVWRVPSLAEDDATLLFVDRATRARPNFSADGTSAPGIAAICRRLDGIPLAVELAAARARMMTVDQILAALDDRFRLLTGGARTAMPRQQTLLASVDWSYALLTADEQALLRRLSVAVGGFSLDAAEAVATSDGLGPLAILDLLTNLVDKSLVVFDDHSIGGRYRLLETIRQFAAQKLAESGEAEAVRNQHLAYFERYGARLAPELEGRDHVTWLDRAEIDLDNFRAACEWALAAGRPEAAGQCVVSLLKLWESAGRWQEGRSWVDRLMPLADAVPDRVRAGLCYVGLSTCYQTGRIVEGMAFCRQAIAFADRAGDERMSARARSGLGYCHAVAGDADLARDYLEDAVDRGRRIEDGFTIAESLAFMGMVDFTAGDIVSTRRRYEESLSEARRWGYGPFVPLMASALGSLLVVQGDLVTARPLLEPAVLEAERTNDQYARSIGLAALGATALAEGRHREAETILRSVLTSARAAEHLMAVTLAGTYLIPTVAVLGGFDEIPELLHEVAAVASLIGWSGVVGMAAAPYAELLIDAGRHDEGMKVLDQVRTLTQHWPPGQPAVHVAEAWQTRHRGDAAATDAALHAALAGAREYGLQSSVIDALEGLSGLGVARGAVADGVRLFAAADSLRRSAGSVALPHRRRAYDDDLAQARSQLGGPAFEAAWAEGAELSADRAVAYASRGRGERKRPPTGWDSLTPAEVNVVRLVAAGLSNPEIASRLFISRRTVSTHVSHIFDKLGLRSRAELASAAARREG